MSEKTTLEDVLARGEEMAAGRPVVRAVGGAGDTDFLEEVSHAELARRAEQAAHGLARLGVGPGDNVALWLTGSIEWFVLHLAAARVGAVTIPLNTRYKAREVQHLLELSRPKVLTYAPAFRGLGHDRVIAEVASLSDSPLSGASLVRVGPATPDEPVLETTPYDALLAATPTGLPDVRAAARTAGIVFGTSGTSSMPKLALHRVTSLAQHALEVADGLGLQPEDHVLGLLPPCGTYGYFAAMAGLAAGARTSVFSSFTPSTLIDVVEREKGTFAALIEGIVRPALAGREQDLDRLRGLRLLACAGQRNVDLVRLLDTVGVSVINMYGASEVHALSALRSPSEPAEERARPGGRITSPDLHVRVVDLETGAVLPEGQEGELQFNGPQRFEAYLGNPEASAKALTQDGWYRSGDLGFVEAGGTRFGYTSRAADSLRSKGFLVSPAEVEELVMSHPSVVAAEVVGAPDAATGEDLLVAFVVPRIHGALDEAELVAFCRDRAAAYKTPAMVVLVPEIPTVVSANGDKSLKRELRERAVGLIRAQVVATEAS